MERTEERATKQNDIALDEPEHYMASVLTLVCRKSRQHGEMNCMIAAIGRASELSLHLEGQATLTLGGRKLSVEIQAVGNDAQDAVLGLNQNDVAW